MMGRSVGWGMSQRPTNPNKQSVLETSKERAHTKVGAKSILASLALQSKGKTPIYFIIHATSASLVTRDHQLQESMFSSSA